MPKVYDVGNGHQQLFEVRELAAACRRSRDCILEWEERGIIPAPSFRYKGRRLYTEAQVVGMRKLVKEHRIKQGRAIPPQFVERARQLFTA